MALAHPLSGHQARFRRSGSPTWTQVRLWSGFSRTFSRDGKRGARGRRLGRGGLGEARIPKAELRAAAQLCRHRRGHCGQLLGADRVAHRVPRVVLSWLRPTSRYPLLNRSHPIQTGPRAAPLSTHPFCSRQISGGVPTHPFTRKLLVQSGLGGVQAESACRRISRHKTEVLSAEGGPWDQEVVSLIPICTGGCKRFALQKSLSTATPLLRSTGLSSCRIANGAADSCHWHFHGKCARGGLWPAA